MARFIASIDQGTTSTRCCIFDRTNTLAQLLKADRAQNTHRLSATD